MAGTDVLGGYDATLLAAQIAQMNAAAMNNNWTTGGYIDPYSMGFAAQPGTMMPTLARDQLNAQTAQYGVQNALDMKRLDAQIQQWATQNQLDTGTLTGFYNGLPTLAREQLAASVGIANADNFRQWATMRGSQLLQQQSQDDAARATGAQARLATLQLLASQKGPENWLAYNSLLNNLKSPDGAATDPFGIAARVEAGVAPRSNIDLQSVWNQAPPAGSQVATPSMSAPAGGASSGAASSTGTGGVGTASLVPSYTPSQPSYSTVPRPSSTGLAISGNPQADAALKAAPASAAGPGWTGADPATLAEFDRISQNMAKAYATQQQNTGGMAGYAEGTPGGFDGDWSRIFNGTGHGLVRDGAFMAGDPQRGQSGPNREVVWNPTHAPMGVVPTSDLPGGTDWASMFSGARSGGVNGINDFTTAFGGAMHNFMNRFGQSTGGTGQDGGAHTLPVPEQPVSPSGAPLVPPPTAGAEMGPPPTPRNGQAVNTPSGQIMVNGADPYWSHIPAGGSVGARLPAFATGTPDFSTNTAFGSFDTFTPDQIAGSPVVKQLQGQMKVPQWSSYYGPDTMRLPGSGALIPNTFNVSDFARQAPSAQAQIQGVYETPRSQGGLGLSWADIMQASTRAAPIGQRWGLAGYGW